MCKKYTHDFHQFNLIPILLIENHTNRRKEESCKKFKSKQSLRLSQFHKSEAMAPGFCNTCSIIPTVTVAGIMYPKDCKNSASTDVCPYCRSVRSELVECDMNQMCSQSSKYHDMSPITHQTCRHFSNSQLQYLSGPCLGNEPADLCQCAKNNTVTRKSSAVKASNCSSTDGWRAFGLVLLGILVVLPTSTMSNPLNHHSQRSGSPHSSGHHSHHSPHRGNERPMKWINPCRIPSSIPTQQTEIQMPTQPDEEIFKNIVTQARKAEVQARQFFEDFRNECFGNTGHDFQELHYDWLKDVADKVGKNLGEPVSQSRLETLEVEDILKSMYRGLQKLAVGLEQVFLDQLLNGGSFYQHFHEAEFQLKYVLCEFQIALMEKNIQYEDVTREIMDQRFVNLENKTLRNFRDFTIFRDYLNTLEFIGSSFDHFWKQSKQMS